MAVSDSIGRRIARAIHHARARLTANAVPPPPKTTRWVRRRGASMNSVGRPIATVQPLIGDRWNAEYTGTPSLVTLGSQPSRLFEVCARRVGFAGWPTSWPRSWVCATIRPLRSKIPALQPGGKVLLVQQRRQYFGADPHRQDIGHP